jgi:hypothetical protein
MPRAYLHRARGRMSARTTGPAAAFRAALVRQAEIVAEQASCRRDLPELAAIRRRRRRAIASRLISNARTRDALGRFTS